MCRVTAYYYILASLPALQFGEAPPLSTAAVLAVCSDWLPASELTRLRHALTPMPSDAPRDAVGRAWQAWQTALRNALAVARASRRGSDAAPYLRSDDLPDPVLRAQIQECVKADDPLHAERTLDRLRWDFLDNLAGIHMFDYHTMVCYLLKLQILERWHALTREQGMAAFNALMTGVHPQ